MSHAETHRLERPIERAALAVLLALGLLLGLVAALDWLLRPEHFPVRNVRFEGEFSRVSHADLAAAVGDAVRGNFLLVDLDAVRRRVEALPWVYRADVRRAWPLDVAVRFEEQRIVAVWGDKAWVNEHGEAVQLPQADLPAMGRSPGAAEAGDGRERRELPRLEGPEGTSALVLESWRRFTPILAATGLTLKRATLTPRRTFELETAEGMVLVLDREAPQHKLERFARARSAALAGRTADIRRVDLRYANGFAVEWRNAGNNGS
jgi:cell division protein FtsQ